MLLVVPYAGQRTQGSHTAVSSANALQLQGPLSLDLPSQSESSPNKGQAKPPKAHTEVTAERIAIQSHHCNRRVRVRWRLQVSVLFIAS